MDEIPLAGIDDPFFMTGVDEASELHLHEGIAVRRLLFPEGPEDKTGDPFQEPDRGKHGLLHERHERRHHGGEAHGIGFPEDLRDGLPEKEQHRGHRGDGEPLPPLAEEADEERRSRGGKHDVDDLVAHDDRDKQATRRVEEPLDMRKEGEAFFPHLVEMKRL